MENMQQYTEIVGTDISEHLWKGREEYTQPCYLPIHQISMNDEGYLYLHIIPWAQSFYFGDW